MISMSQLHSYISAAALTQAVALSKSLASTAVSAPLVSAWKLQLAGTTFLAVPPLIVPTFSLDDPLPSWRNPFMAEIAVTAARIA